MKKVLIALLVLTACGTSVFAGGEWKKDGSVMLGMGMPGGDVGKTVDSGMAFGLDYDGYKINDNWSVAGAFIYTSSPKKSATLVDYTLSTWGLTPYAKYSKEVDLGGKKCNVYGAAGIGYYSVSFKEEGTGVLAGLTSDATDTKFGFNLGGGIMYPIADKMQLGLDLRYHMVASNLSYFVPAVKFTYSF